VKLVWDCPFDLPSVQADRHKLKQILENLIDNAIKFTDGGTITIAARYLSSKQVLELTVADTGTGIAREQISTIFERFRQGQEAQRGGAARGGVGLGLYIVKRYVDLLGGKIDVESRPGEGSVFTAEIPAPLKRGYSSHDRPILPTDSENISALSR
jgi:signal transduction histidine kinase